MPDDPRIPLLIIAGPRASPRPDAVTLVLCDDARYPASMFEPYARRLELGPGVATADRSGEPGYTLDADSLSFIRLSLASLGPVVLSTPSDTHVKTFEPLARRLANPRWLTIFSRRAGAETALQALGLPYQRHGLWRHGLQGASAVLLGIDWSREEQLLIARARRRGIPTACLQESVIDLDDPVARRMRWADHALIQGPRSLRYLRRSMLFLTGNPRYDRLSPSAPPARAHALINCNFTYGLHEEAALGWVTDAVRACESEGVAYTISVHPRCRTDLSSFRNIAPSNAFKVGGQLETCSMLITRFSSLGHEALLKGRRVIYHNPHGETTRYFLDDDTGLIAKSHDSATLAQAVRASLGAPPEEVWRRGTMDLFTQTDGRSLDRVHHALAVIAARGGSIRTTDAQRADPLTLRASALYRTWRPRFAGAKA